MVGRVDDVAVLGFQVLVTEMADIDVSKSPRIGRENHRPEPATAGAGAGGGKFTRTVSVLFPVPTFQSPFVISGRPYGFGPVSHQKSFHFVDFKHPI